MHAIVLGAGVIGVTTAYYLAEQGCRVTVIDRSDDVACGASHANGGQLSYSYTESLAGNGFFSKIPGLLLGSDIAIRVQLATKLLPWGARFLRECTSARASSNMVALLNTAMRSASLMSELRQRVAFDYSYRPAGKLVLLSNDEEIRVAEANTLLKQQHGGDVEMLSAFEAAQIEPAIDALDKPIEAAVYSQSDEVADAELFVRGLRDYLEQAHQVKFRLGTEAHKIDPKQGRVTGVQCDEFVKADAVVVCLGAWSGEFLHGLGINPHIYPVRGYSVTLPLGNAAPSVSLTSLQNRFVLSRLNGNMRVAGFTDFDGFNSAADADRVSTLVETARRVAPLAADYDCEQQHAWGGFRPMTPNGQPIVGSTKLDGLYLNTGHGMLGWTLACASGKTAADAVMKAN